MNTETRRSRSNDALTGTSPFSDEVLVSIALDGIERAFEDLVAGHLHDAIRVAAEIVGLDLAEDVVQNAVFLAHRDLASLHDRTRFSPWFLAITRWQALRVERLERRRPFRRAASFEPFLESLSHLASDPRLIDAGDGPLLAGL
jgi:DNA-directed RNA polymerase specialized sigma24 family protein